MTDHYWPFDQDIKLGPRPWNPVDVRDWEEAHGHDIRLKCFPEFDCRVVEASYEHRIKTLRQGLAHRMGENERLKGAFDEISALMGKSNDLLVRRKREMERERDQARAAREGIIQRVRELHQALPVYLMADECECPNRDEHEVMEAEHGDLLLCMASPTEDRHCRECSHYGDDEPTDHPCATIRALDTADQEQAADELSRLGQQQDPGPNPFARDLPVPIRVDARACRIMWGPGCTTYHGGHECHHGDGHDGPHTCPCGATADGITWLKPGGAS